MLSENYIRRPADFLFNYFKGKIMNIYYKVFKTSLANQLEYRVNFISGFLFSLFPFTVNVLLWLAVSYQSTDMPLEAGGIVSYYFLTLITYNITSTVSIFKVSDDIRLGTLNTYLIKPYNYAIYQLASDLPHRFVFITMNALPILILYFLLSPYFVFNFFTWKIVFFMLFLFAGYLINFLIDFLIALYSFYFSRVSSLYTSIRVLKNISAGIIFPLVFLPESVFKVLKNLPFAFISHIPVSFLLDNESLYGAFLHLLKAVSWIAVLSVFCAIVWKKGLKKYSAYGG